jgi:probable poly-beta-1,6-N-acetyl-D-glucosamine export protein
MAKRGRIVEIDIVRALAIFAVIAIHSTTNPIVHLNVHSSMYPFYCSVNTFGAFAVPTFIMLSGFVLFYNYYPRNFGTKAVKDFYSKRILYIAIPYITISLLYYVFNRYYVGKSLSGMAWDFTNKLISGHNNYHLYYMVIIIQFFIVFPIILGLLKKSSWLAKNSWWLGFVGQWLFWYLNAHYIHYSRTAIIPFTYFSYFFVGAYIGIYYESAKTWLFDPLRGLPLRKKIFRIFLLLLWAVSTVGYLYLIYRSRIGSPLNVDASMYTLFYNVFTLSTGLVFSQWSFWIYRKFSKQMWVRGLIVLGMISFGVYLIHPFFYIFYNRINYSGVPLIYNLEIAGKFLVGAIFSWILVYYSSKYFPLSWVLFGKSGVKKVK